MANVIKLSKGLNINLKGKAKGEKMQAPQSTEFAVSPSDFPGVIPKLSVKEGDKVLAGEPLFFNKNKCSDFDSLIGQFIITFYCHKNTSAKSISSL